MELHPLLTLTAPERPLDRALLDARGGFAWWYLDLLDSERSGVVMIWSFGLPFLPGYLSAARSGRPERPRDRPALNVVIYERGRPMLYLLEEHAPDEASWSLDGTRFRFGRSEIESSVVDGRRIVRAALDCTIPGSSERLRATIDVSGPARRMAGAEPRDVDARFHDWTPLTAVATGSATFTIGARRTAKVAGRAYHDRNGSHTALDQLGIAEWVWGRATLPDRELIWYLLWPARSGAEATFLGIEMDHDGTTRLLDHLTVRASGERRARFGMRWWGHLELTHQGRPWLSVKQEAPVDDGPFYLRSFVQAASADGRIAIGTGEVCVPSRIDSPWHRPFVRMRVHRVGEENSRWLPLFAGPRDDRTQRLARTLLGVRMPSADADVSPQPR